MYLSNYLDCWQCRRCRCMKALLHEHARSAYLIDCSVSVHERCHAGPLGPGRVVWRYSCSWLGSASPAPAAHGMCIAPVCPSQSSRVKIAPARPNGSNLLFSRPNNYQESAQQPRHEATSNAPSEREALKRSSKEPTKKILNPRCCMVTHALRTERTRKTTHLPTSPESQGRGLSSGFRACTADQRNGLDCPSAQMFRRSHGL